MNDNDNRMMAVGCVVRRDNKVLLVRHTYGSAQGKLLIPGGYCQFNELPGEAAVREVQEETGISAKPIALIGVRFHRRSWYALFLMDYEDGIAQSDENENNEAYFCEMTEVLKKPDVTEMTKVALKAVLDKDKALLYPNKEYQKHKGTDYELYI